MAGIRPTTDAVRGLCVGRRHARGMGEMPFLPATVYDATGVRFDEFPLTPELVWRGLREQK